MSSFHKPVAPLQAVDPIGAGVSAETVAYAGTSGWAYSSWKPGFYPAGASQKKFLEYYASRLNSVEVNYTFRSLPTEAMLNTWLAAVGPEFRFSFKAPQRITHVLRLKDCGEALERFAGALKPVVKARRMGVVLFQLPPNFKADAARLNAFLHEARKTRLRLAFEFRNASWFTDEVFSILRKHKAALCVAESDELETPDIVTAPFACYRFRKSRYSKKKLGEIAAGLCNRSGDVYAYFKHEEEPTGALRAVAVLKMCREKTRSGPEVEVLKA